MLHKNRSKNSNQVKYALILPLIAAFIFTFNTTVIAQTKESKTVKKITDKHQGVQKNVQLVIITKDINDQGLEKVKKDFSKEGVTVKFKGVKRNDKGEITAINIDVSSKQSNATFNTNSDKPIKPIKISFDEKGGNIALGNNNLITHGDTEGFYYISKNENHKVKTNGKGNQNFIFVSNDGKHDEHEVIEIKGDGDAVFIIKKEGNHEIIGDEVREIIEIRAKSGGIKNIWVTEDGNKSIEIIKIKEDRDSNNNGLSFSDNEKDMIFYIDEKEVSKEDIAELDPNMIEKMNVLKGDKAIEKYGAKAKGGVIMITTKKE